MNLEEKIELVKKDILTRFPNCHYTIKILLWDDGTDSVECRHGDGEYIYRSTYYNNNLEYSTDKLYVNRIKIDMYGDEVQVMTPEEWGQHMKIN